MNGRHGQRHVLITGATGGIGAATARLLAQRGCRLTLLARDSGRLEALAGELSRGDAEVGTLAADLLRLEALDGVVARAVECRGPIDVLVNNAAVNWFGRFDTMPEAEIGRLLATDLEAPLRLVRAVLPDMLRRGQGQIVNIGSVFGAIGFAGFSVYSACKFALRGFSEALRRELRGTGVAVSYIAPRYTRTAFNDRMVERMAEAIGLRMDEPARVAERIVAAMAGRRADTVIGWPERFFARLNGAFPGLVDSGVAKTNRRILRIADSGNRAQPPL